VTSFQATGFIFSL